MRRAHRANLGRSCLRRAAATRARARAPGSVVPANGASGEPRASGVGAADSAGSRSGRRPASIELAREHPGPQFGGCSAVIFVRLPKRAARIRFVSPDCHPRASSASLAQPWMRPRRRASRPRRASSRAASALISLSSPSRSGRSLRSRGEQRAAHRALGGARNHCEALLARAHGASASPLRASACRARAGLCGTCEARARGRIRRGRARARTAARTGPRARTHPAPDTGSTAPATSSAARESRTDGRRSRIPSVKHLAVAHHGSRPTRARDGSPAIRGRERSVEVLGWDALRDERGGDVPRVLDRRGERDGARALRGAASARRCCPRARSYRRPSRALSS